MADAVLDGHVVATVLVERTLGNCVRTGESVLTAELVQRAVALPHSAVVLGDGNDAFLLYTTIGNGLLHLDFYAAGS